jgi:hypothetical protein
VAELSDFEKTVGNTMEMVFTVSPPFIHWDTFSKKSQSGFQEAKTTMNRETKPFRKPATLPGRIGKGPGFSCIIKRAELHGHARHDSCGVGSRRFAHLGDTGLLRG